jgi:hypothetical protein
MRNENFCFFEDWVSESILKNYGIGKMHINVSGEIYPIHMAYDKNSFHDYGNCISHLLRILNLSYPGLRGYFIINDIYTNEGYGSVCDTDQEFLKDYLDLKCNTFVSI